MSRHMTNFLKIRVKTPLEVTIIIIKKTVRIVSIGHWDTNDAQMIPVNVPEFLK